MSANFVQETTTTTGAGPLTLAGRVATFSAFTNALTNLSVVRYVIEASNGDREEGVGTFTTTGTTLSRDKIISTWVDATTTYDKSPAAALTLPAGTHTVSITPTVNSHAHAPMGRRNGTRVISANIPNTDQVSAGTLTANVHYTIPFLLAEPLTATKLGIYIVTGVDATTARLGLSRMGADSLGIDMLADVAVLVTTTENSTAQEGTFTAIDLAAGWYMVHFTSDGAIRVGNTAIDRNPAAYPLANMNTSNRLYPACFMTASSTSAALNAPEAQTTVSTSNSTSPIIWLST